MPDTNPSLELIASRHFVQWLEEVDASLAFTTYQSGKLFLVGRNPDGRLSIFERTMNRCMGLWSDGQVLWISTLSQLWRFQNSLSPSQTFQGYDRVYAPRQSYVTGDLDVHDLVLESAGRLVFANTLFSCLATTDDHANFREVWKPPFIDRLAAEDRCHLNGVATVNGKLRFVSLVARSNVADGWREHRLEGGCLYDVESNECLMQGLCMPHSPRWHQGRLWLLESGSGQLGFAESGTWQFQPFAFCPGYPRGLSLIGDYAVVGTSRTRNNPTFAELPLQQELARRGAEPRCGLCVFDLRSGDLVHWLRIEGVVQELYDVANLPGVRRPMAIGFQGDEIRRMITIA